MKGQFMIYSSSEIEQSPEQIALCEQIAGLKVLKPQSNPTPLTSTGGAQPATTPPTTKDPRRRREHRPKSANANVSTSSARQRTTSSSSSSSVETVRETTGSKHRPSDERTLRTSNAKRKHSPTHKKSHAESASLPPSLPNAPVEQTTRANGALMADRSTTPPAISPPARSRGLTRTLSFRDLSSECDADADDAKFMLPESTLHDADDALHGVTLTPVQGPNTIDQARECAEPPALGQCGAQVEESVDDGFEDEDQSKGTLELLLATLMPREPEVKSLGFFDVFPFKHHKDRFELCIVPVHRQLVLWDMPIDTVYTWRAMLYLIDREAQNFDRPLLLPAPAEPPVERLDIEFRSLSPVESADTDSDSDSEQGDTNRPFGEIPHTTQFVSFYTGSTLNVKDEDVQYVRLNLARGIARDTHWKFFPPGTLGAAPGGTWGVQLFVPLPMRLLHGRETQRYRVRSRARLRSWNVKPETVDSGPVEVSVDHLFRERDMERVKR
ncbi:hypothetical protein B0H21DRAFT_139302 [Amylocystis lapponica]|nr:hypothetical protein B0H21DRAFT_139302 [Amylocystis lapponica]